MRIPRPEPWLGPSRWRPPTETFEKTSTLQSLRREPGEGTDLVPDLMASGSRSSMATASGTDTSCQFEVDRMSETRTVTEFA